MVWSFYVQHLNVEIPCQRKHWPPRSAIIPERNNDQRERFKERKTTQIIPLKWGAIQFQSSLRSHEANHPEIVNIDCWITGPGSVPSSSAGHFIAFKICRIRYKMTYI